MGATGILIIIGLVAVYCIGAAIIERSEESRDR